MFDDVRAKREPRPPGAPRAPGAGLGDRLGTVVFLVVAALVVALIVVLYVATEDRLDDGSAAGGPAGAASSRDLEPSEPSGTSTDSSTATPTVVVVGDAFSAGTTGPAWPELLAEATGWDVATYTDAAASYLGRGDRRTMAELVDEATSGPDPDAVDLVVVAGGRYDAGRGSYDRVSDAAVDVVETAEAGFPEASVVLLSNFASGPPTDDSTRLAGRLRTAAGDAGASYVDVTGYLADRDVDPATDLPLAAGQETVAAQLGEDLPDLGSN